MSAFSEMLSCEIKQNDVSGMRISACTGISRANVSKILTGQKIPTHSELSLILSILPITQSKAHTIKEELDNTRFGISLCSQLEKLLKKVEAPPAPQPTVLSHAVSSNIDKIGIIEGKTTVLSYIQNALQKEISTASPTVYTNITSDCSLLQEGIMYVLANAESDVDFRICTNMDPQTKNGFENFSRLFEWAPFFIKKCDILYEYSQENYNTIPFGYSKFLILHNTIILTNQATDSAVVFTEEAVVEKLKNFCRLRFSNMKSLVRRCSTPFEVFDITRKIPSKYSGYSYLQHYPCILPYLEYKHFQQIAKDDIPEVQAILPALYEYYIAHRNGLNRGAFTLSGLMDLSLNGTIKEVPKEYINPVPKEIRRYGLEKLLESIKNGADFRIVNENCLSLPENTVIDLWNECQLVFTWKPSNINSFTGQISSVTNEVTLLHEASKFFDVLFESRYLHTKDHSIDIITQCIESIK